MKTLVIVLCLAGGASALTGCGGDEGAAAVRPAASARPTASPSPPVEIALKPAHHSGVRGTATLVPAGANLKVTLKLSKPVEGNLLAHIHWGPCSKEPTMAKPRIWASLTEVVGGRSETTVNTVTLKELQSEAASINVHDPTHANRPLVCGDIPRAG
jgi:hypothetical protein